MSPRPQHQWQAEDTGDTQDRPSRSQRKRDSSALQELGESLTRLSPASLARLPLSEDLRAALVEYRRLSSHEAKRRQMQYLGRLMREVPDPQALADAVEDLRG